MWKDPIVEEIRAHREAHAAEFDYELSAICRDLRRQQAASSRRVVRLPARRAQPVDSVARKGDPGVDGNESSEQPDSAADLASEIRRVIATELRLSEELLDGDVTFEDLGLDSLTSVEVLLAIEKQLKCTLDAAQLVETHSPDTPLSVFISSIADTVAPARALADEALIEASNRAAS